MLPEFYNFEKNFYEKIPTKLYVFAIGKIFRKTFVISCIFEIFPLKNVQLVLTFDVPKQFHIVQHTLPIAGTVDYQMSGGPGVIGMYSWPDPCMHTPVTHPIEAITN
jgi:hypothetical protein